MSERENPAGFVLDDKGEVNPEGDLLLDYVGVCEVEAWLAMDAVRVGYENEVMVVTLPEVQLNPVVNYGMSFVWRESKGIPNAAVPNVLEAIRNRAAAQAEERGIRRLAEDAAERWFRAFLEPFSEKVEIRSAQSGRELPPLP